MRVEATTLAVGAFLLAATLLGGGATRADVFSMADPNLKSLEFVTVGDPGNAADTTGYGAVPYTYRMGTYDVTAAMYAQFLNAVATQSDPFGLYNPTMAGGPGSAACGITRTGSPGNYSYNTTSSGYVGVNSGNFPVNYVSWGDAARFANWLANGQPTNTTEGAGTTETGSYTLNGAMDDSNLMAVTRNPGARYVIPTEDEWYKAAYYDPNKPGGAGYWVYPTRSDTVPSNALDANGTNNANYNWSDLDNGLTVVGAFASSPGPYGTYDMGGDLFQVLDSNHLGTERIARGGAFHVPLPVYLDSSFPGAIGPPSYSSYTGLGFRIAQVPEPGALSSMGILILLAIRRPSAKKKMRKQRQT